MKKEILILLLICFSILAVGCSSDDIVPLAQYNPTNNKTDVYLLPSKDGDIVDYRLTLNGEYLGRINSSFKEPINLTLVPMDRLEIIYNKNNSYKEYSSLHIPDRPAFYYSPIFEEVRMFKFNIFDYDMNNLKENKLMTYIGDEEIIKLDLYGNRRFSELDCYYNYRDIRRISVRDGSLKSWNDRYYVENFDGVYRESFEIDTGNILQTLYIDIGLNPNNSFNMTCYINDAEYFLDENYEMKYGTYNYITNKDLGFENKKFTVQFEVK